MALVEGRVLETVLTDILSNQLPRFAGSGCRLLSGVVLISRESRKRRLDVWRNVNILLSVVVSVSLLSSKVEGKRFIHCCLFFSDVCPSKEMMSKGHAGRVGRHPPRKVSLPQRLAAQLVSCIANVSKIMLLAHTLSLLRNVTNK